MVDRGGVSDHGRHSGRGSRGDTGTDGFQIVATDIEHGVAGRHDLEVAVLFLTHEFHLVTPLELGCLAVECMGGMMSDPA